MLSISTCCIELCLRRDRPVCPERGSLDCVLELASSATLMVLFSRLMISHVARMNITRRNTAPPIIPPSSAVGSPPPGAEVEVGDVFAIGVSVTGIAATLGTTDPEVATVVVGAPITVWVVIVVKIMDLSPTESVVVKDSVTMNVKVSVV